MTRSVAIATVLLAATTACTEDAALEPELLVPEDLVMHWDRAFNGEDDARVALVPVDLMVYEAESGEPVVAAELMVEPGHPAVEVLPFDDILPLDAEDCDSGPCLWDAWRDRYVEVVDSPVSEPLSTDANGLVRAYLLVDAFPESVAADTGFEPVPVVVTMGATDASFDLVPQ